MKTEINSKQERLAYFGRLYERAKTSFAEKLSDFERHMRQYRGSREIDGSNEPATKVRNITYEIIESQVSSEIPLPKVDAACYSERRGRCAQSIERLLSSVRDRLPFEQMNDLDERYTYIYGASVWYAEWDSTGALGNERGDVRVLCLSPKDLIPQPNIARIEDMDYCFLRFTTTKKELRRKYGVSEEALAMANVECESEGAEDEDSVTQIVCFYRQDDGEVGQYIFSGELELRHLPSYYHRKRKRCRRCHALEGECECQHPDFELENEPIECLNRRITMQDGSTIEEFSPALKEGGVLQKSKNGYVMKRTELPYYVPKHFPIVIRKNTSMENSLWGQSDCEYLRPEQQAINKIESRILQKLLRAGITPIVPEDATITMNNSVFGQLIKMKPGESASQYGKVDTTPDISQDIAEAERLYNHAKRTLGITDAYQGISNSQNESGYARQLQISQSSGRLDSKKKMKHTAYADLYRILFEYYLAFADEPRSLCFRDAYGRVHNAEFNRYDFIEYDIRTGEYYYDDAYLFSVDQNGAIEGQRSEVWQRNLENLTSGALGDRENPMTLLRYWQAQERAHYPYARENVEYFISVVEDAERNKTQYEPIP